MAAKFLIKKFSPTTQTNLENTLKWTLTYTLFIVQCDFTKTIETMSEESGKDIQFQYLEMDFCKTANSSTIIVY